ncbi:hypothetical protein NDU88_001166 [Pleurodeles waltl]|uniref:Uncharacterized protein n=1 Tax=Pleurodeles waltl TaxID=8319 RepID=A0AAV7VY79_PLEWA|nr:hypothetical protein NDU88_001166 [Pleurodeles waltl]
MPRGKTAGKVPCKPARQPLFSEALRQQKHPATTDSPPPSHDTMSEDTQGASMDRILQEISAVGRKLEGMDTAMSALTAETRSMRLEIAGFQAHRLGLKRQHGKDRPRPIIACFLRHGQIRQLLQLSRRQGPLRLDPLEIRLSSDFSKETADRRRAFLSLRPRLRHLNIKFSLFEPARMWITKNGESRIFYDPEDLKSFLEGLHDPTQPMESTTQPPQDAQNQTRGMGQSEIALDIDGRPITDPQTRGRDLERLTKSFDDRGQFLQAVAMHTQLPDRDKSRSPLKP